MDLKSPTTQLIISSILVLGSYNFYLELNFPKRKFDSYDKDGDGEITFEEMGTVMRNKPVAKVQAEFNKLNTDGNGAIDFQDFLTRMMASWLKDVKTYFLALDQDGNNNGYV